MTSDAVLRDHLLHLLAGGQAHAGPEEVFRDIPEAAMHRGVPGLPYTAWEQLEHLRIAQWDILEFVRDPRHVSPDWPAGYWRASEAGMGRAEWDASLEAFRADLEAVKALGRDTAVDLTAPLPHAPTYTILREVLLVADHNAHHLGQIIVLRRLLDCWPPAS